MTLRIAVAGITGRMGREIVAAAREDDGVEIIGGTSRTGPPLVDLLAAADVVIDMTLPDATVRNAESCATAGVPFVTGTTGLDAAQQHALAVVAETIPVFHARNLSVGIAAMIRVLPSLVAALPGFDVEIIETHHRHKADAPSGTAMALVEAIAAESGSDPDAAAVYGRSGHAPRRAGEIGVHAVRAGGNPGEHTVLCAGEGEEIRISHRAYSRHPYALGALRAAHWIHDRRPGLYGMDDLLAAFD